MVTMHMCPRCHGELHKKHFKGVSIEECPQCKGLFFDLGELEKARDNTDENLRWLDFVPFDVKERSSHTSEAFHCPNCDAAMDAFQYPGSKVVINKCPKCQGVWLEKGEFEKVIDYLTKLVAGESSGELGEDWKKQAGEVFGGGSKPELEEIRDLVAVTRLLEERWTAEHPFVEKLIEYYYELTPFK